MCAWCPSLCCLPHFSNRPSNVPQESSPCFALRREQSFNILISSHSSKPNLYSKYSAYYYTSLWCGHYQGDTQALCLVIDWIWHFSSVPPVFTTTHNCITNIDIIVLCCCHWNDEFRILTITFLHLCIFCPPNTFCDSWKNKQQPLILKIPVSHDAPIHYRYIIIYVNS